MADFFAGPMVKVNSRGRPLRIHHLLLQFSTDFDNSFCILFTIGWTTFLLLRILNFDLRPKWHRLKVGKFFFLEIPKSSGRHFVLGQKFKILSNK